MKNLSNYIKKGAIALSLMAAATPMATAADPITWGDFKLFLDPGHAGTENGGLYGYSEAQKVLRVAWAIRDDLKAHTDITDEQLKLCRETDADYVSLDERSDMANAWGADFYYSIHSDASGAANTTLFLFGGWKNNGTLVEKTPNGGKAFGDILMPNLSGVMRVNTRGNFYDRSYYESGVDTHENQYPYLSVNRRTNMASLLSEGGYHTLAEQQQRNLNDSYKRLEGFAAFRSILKYRGLECPVQTFLTGVVTNSENGVPVNGVSVTVDGKTIVTDSYESLFNKYTSNPDLIHNGFFSFEGGLEIGKEYEVSFSSDEFGTATKKVTIVSDPQGLSADNITWCDIQMTSTKPARVAATSIENPLAVSLRDDILITFSRNMDKASVEAAFTVNNNGEVTLSWDSPSILRINISKLKEDFDYQFKIDGTIAKNSQTQQFLDGNGDGTEGGDYTLDIMTLPPDVTPPTIVSTSPSDNKTMEYTLRPVIRVEFNELLLWDSENVENNLITVVDKEGNSYSGVLRHDIINKASVLHFYFNQDLPADKCYLVKVLGGLHDLAGNVSEEHSFRFLSEYRPVIDSAEIDDLTNIGNWYQPHGSGTSDGWTTEAANDMYTTSQTSNLNRTSCFEFNYEFDPLTTDPFWRLRIYMRMKGAVADNTGILQSYIYGDGSYNHMGFCVRANKGGGGVKSHTGDQINYKGWNLLTWKMDDGNYEHISGTDELTGKWYFDAMFFTHENIEEGTEVENPDTGESEIVPVQAWNGRMRFDDLKYVHYDNTAVQTASIQDIDPSGVDEVIAAGINITNNGDILSVIANSTINTVAIYNVAGERMYFKAINGSSMTFDARNLASGMYIVKVNAQAGQKAQKVIF